MSSQETTGNLLDLFGFDAPPVQSPADTGAGMDRIARTITGEKTTGASVPGPDAHQITRAITGENSTDVVSSNSSLENIIGEPVSAAAPNQDQPEQLLAQTFDVLDLDPYKTQAAGVNPIRRSQNYSTISKEDPFAGLGFSSVGLLIAHAVVRMFAIVCTRRLSRMIYMYTYSLE